MLKLDQLRVTYDKSAGPVVDDLDLEVARGELLVLLGPSGCGKSTTLNAIAGLIEPDGGSIIIDDEKVYDRSDRTMLSPNRRHVGMVFQSYALWPHMSVRDNVAFPVARGRTRREIANAVSQALRTVQCEHLADRLPAHLSGGQQQRVALARAIVGRPKMLLFDEPLSNLDAGLRLTLRNELARLHGDLDFTGVYVTHDQAEALVLGTRLAVMNGGRIEQIGRPVDVYRAPQTAYVARFFGANLFAGRIEQDAAGSTAVTPFGALLTASAANPDEATIAIYPERITLQEDPAASATVVLARFVGRHMEYRITAGDDELFVQQPVTTPWLAEGTRVSVGAAPSDVHTFQRQPTAERAAAP